MPFERANNDDGRDVTYRRQQLLLLEQLVESLILGEYLLLYLYVLGHGGLQERLMDIRLVREHAVARRPIAGGVGRVRGHTET